MIAMIMSDASPMPRPSEPHARLASLAGRWTAEETLHPSPFSPAGGARRATTVNRMDVDGFFLVNQYTQTEGDRVVFRGLGVYGWDPGRAEYSMYWVDSMGTPPADVVWGTWEGDTLTFARSGPRGHSRYVYVLEAADRYVFRLESSADGAAWTTLMTGVYTRVADA